MNTVNTQSERRMREMRTTYKILVGITERRPGRLWLRCGGSFKMDLQELGLWMLNGFSWRRIGPSDMLLWKSWGNIRVD